MHRSCQNNERFSTELDANNLFNHVILENKVDTKIMLGLFESNLDVVVILKNNFTQSFTQHSGDPARSRRRRLQQCRWWEFCTKPEWSSTSVKTSSVVKTGLLFIWTLRTQVFFLNFKTCLLYVLINKSIQ